MNVFSLMEMVAAIENTSDSVQLFLKNAMSDILYRTKGSIQLPGCYELDAVLSTGILQETDGKYSFSESAKKKARKLYTYLVRKFDTELYFDPETCQTIDIPKGAVFVGTIDVSSGESSISLHFPDDEVTELLDLFGVNPCKKWP